MKMNFHIEKNQPPRNFQPETHYFFAAFIEMHYFFFREEHLINIRHYEVLGIPLDSFFKDEYEKITKESSCEDRDESSQKMCKLMVTKKRGKWKKTCEISCEALERTE